MTITIILSHKRLKNLPYNLMFRRLYFVSIAVVSIMHNSYNFSILFLEKILYLFELPTSSPAERFTFEGHKFDTSLQQNSNRYDLRKYSIPKILSHDFYCPAERGGGGVGDQCSYWVQQLSGLIRFHCNIFANFR
jgi:hypothetical protein